jgi:hypothetical protein
MTQKLILKIYKNGLQLDLKGAKNIEPSIEDMSFCYGYLLGIRRGFNTCQDLNYESLDNKDIKKIINKKKQRKK